ncbi:unnamed protein product [Arctogadus glacialis]
MPPHRGSALHPPQAPLSPQPPSSFSASSRLLPAHPGPRQHLVNTNHNQETFTPYRLMNTHQAAPATSPPCLLSAVFYDHISAPDCVLLEGVLLEGVFLGRPFVQLSRSGG